jgi:hypothetical protein
MEAQHFSPEGHSESNPFGQGVWHFSASTQSMPQLFLGGPPPPLGADTGAGFVGVGAGGGT